ncbi:metal ABC transporter substrate-binding protein [Aliibacillus thermotolerans]|mgnify:CR=1 FL=1|uniref:Metal ABC transporter substrate-binding protein n=1 Tax=Aliibacillus thermotolerans TaxID=1834418 RepID=A0ABW0U950_9BACI|nr:zinc ABC transporter substrate-binding protein [Aliibacillus thermotolerans]MDA3131158.1 adhesin [Aliibacillus thermotolerans]
MKRGVFIYSVLLFLMIILSGCGEEQEEINEEKDEVLTVYTTLFVWEDIATQIGGEHVQVKNIVPPGSDAHSFEPTAQMMIDIAEADAFIYTGQGMEGFADAVEKAVSNENTKMIQVTEGMQLNESDAHGHEDHEGHHHDVDPHVWLDPVLMVEAVETISAAFSDLLPEHQHTFLENKNRIVADIEELHEQFTEVVNEAERKTIVVSHRAYGYWEERYGIEQLALTGLDPAYEPSQKEIEEMIARIKNEKIPYILVESNISAKVADVIQSETGVERLPIHNLETVTEEEQKKGYMELMEENIAHVQQALE